MRTSFLLINFSITLFLLIGCSSNGSTNGQNNTLPTDTLPGTKSPTPDVSSNFPLSSSQACPTEVNDPPQNLTSNVIVLWDQTGDKTRVYLWNVDLDTKKDLPGDEKRSFPPDMMVSPDHKWLAFFEYLKNPENTLDPVRLSIADSVGNVIVSVDNTWENWTGLVGWLDNDQLMLDRFVSGDSPHPTVFLNPFTNDSSAFVADYPEIHSDTQHFMGWWGGFATTMAIYDSSLNLVVYPLSNSKIVLFDKRKGSELTRIDIGNVTGSAPQWSPDYQMFAVDISSRGIDPYASYYSDELYVVDRNGYKNGLTNFTETFSAVDIQEYAWSPDGRHIAFWYSTQPEEENYELVIIDVTTKKLSTFCINDFVRNDELRLFPPVWSPDGTQILVRGWTSTETELGKSEDSNVILVDIEKNFVSKIAEKAVPRGWMIDY